MDLIDLILKYVVVPVAAFVWGVHMRVTKQSTDIAVLTVKLAAHEAARAESERRVEVNMGRIMEKLDSIEAALRK